MLINYLKVAFRSILRNRLTSIINIAGLTLALSCVLLIALYIVDELSYDKQHPQSDRLYRVTRYFYNQEGGVSLRLANVAPPIAPLLQNDFPEIENIFRMLNTNTTVTLREGAEIKKAFREQNIYIAEPEILEMLEVNITEGNATTLLKDPFTIMLTEEMAMKYFGTTQVQGKHIQAFSAGFEFMVSGVYKSFRTQTHFHPDFLISFSTLNDSTIYGRQALERNWGNNAFGTYILLKKGESANSLQSKFPDFLDRHFGPFAIANFGVAADFVASKATSLQLQPVTDLHLKSHLDDELEPPGSINNVYLMAVIGFFILLIASFNFINLSTAQASKRSKEVGIRKVAGALKQQLVWQYLSESVLIALFSCALTFAVGYLAIGWLNNFTGKSIQLFGNHMITVALIGGTILVGLLAGIYPAFVISSFKPAHILKGSKSGSGSKGLLRRSLVVVQFAISIVLIIATGVIFSQLQYLNNKELGYKRDQVITVPYYSQLGDGYDAFYNELTENAAIQNVGRSSRIPTGRLLDSMGASMMKNDSLQRVGVRIAFIRVDYGFFNAYGIDFAAGRDFSREVPTDDSLGFVLNKAAIDAMGISDPADAIGQDFSYGGTTGKIIGIVNDFHFESLHEKINPIIFFIGSNNFSRLSIQVAGDNFQAGLDHIEKVWSEYLPDRLFEYTFLDEQYKNLYESETRQSQLFTGFAVLAIFIGCLGLFGLATFNTMQRIKEIGIRKVLGASVPHILALLSREIVMLVLVANLLAWPMAWYVMDKWLSNFAYRIDINPVLFILAAVAATLIALMTVSSQTIRAAMTNPANTLRYE